MSTPARTSQPIVATQSDPRWASVVARDPEVDGKYYFSVKTTGVYCRPSCAARRARPENVQFHASCEEAERAGFRPCKRCKPKQSLSVAAQTTSKIAKACRLIEGSEQSPGLDQLAQHAGLSAYHFHRLFKKVTGLTPKSYAVAHREKLLRTALARSRTGDRSDLRRRIQLEWALLRNLKWCSWYDTFQLPRWRHAHRHPLCRGRIFPWLNSGRSERSRSMRHPSRRRPGRAGARLTRPFSQSQSDWR